MPTNSNMNPCEASNSIRPCPHLKNHRTKHAYIHTYNKFSQTLHIQTYTSTHSTPCRHQIRVGSKYVATRSAFIPIQRTLQRVYIHSHSPMFIMHTILYSPLTSMSHVDIPENKREGFPPLGSSPSTHYHVITPPQEGHCRVSQIPRRQEVAPKCKVCNRYLPQVYMPVGSYTCSNTSIPQCR